MTVTCIDGEWTITKKSWTSETSGKVQEYIDNTPYCPENKLVSIGYQTSDGDKEYIFFHHKHFLNIHGIELAYRKKKLQDVLDKTTLLVAYHAASDLTWLRESGFKYDGAVYDPLAFEYISSFGMKTPLSLKAVLEKHNLPSKEDVLSKYYAEGKNTDEIPIDILEKYGINDVDTLVLLFNRQKELFGWDEKIKSIKPILRLTNEFLPVAVDMARSGIKIDIPKLLLIEKNYRKELAEIQTKLLIKIKEVMGATPINVDSPEQLSHVFYSRKILDKQSWAQLFNIGTEMKNGVSKKKHAPTMTSRKLFSILQTETAPLKKTKAFKCEDCHGSGYTTPLKKDGSVGKARRICKACQKEGVIYQELDEEAGFGIYPPGARFATSGGFATSSDAIEIILKDPSTTEEARNFLSLIERRNAISMYLSTFIEGIQKYLHAGYLNMEYNQYVTATGRLSSRFHNLPKGKTFPIKEAFISRFEGGKIVNIDFAQLEFRVAATLANDAQAIQDILNKIDVHTNTMNALCDAGEPTDRDGAKSRTFKPLYGGSTGTDAEKIYYEWFLNRYSGIETWQTSLGDQALTRKYTQSPSGRIYAFPYTKMQGNGRVSGFTQIANYQVQGFGFDIVMACIVELAAVLKGMRAIPIMTIHDSVVLDVHPDELQKVLILAKNTLDNVKEIVHNKFNYELKVPLAYDISIGSSWGNQMKLEI